MKMSDQYITIRLRSIERMIKAGRITKAVDALTMLRLRANSDLNSGMGQRLQPWEKRIRAIELSIVDANDSKLLENVSEMEAKAKATWANAEPGDTIGKVKMSHTPGPWYTMAKGNKYQSAVNQENTGKTIAVTYTSNDSDAYLIAAAPELLEALRLCVARLEEYGDAEGGTALECARYTIAKAEQP